MEILSKETVNIFLKVILKLVFLFSWYGCDNTHITYTACRFLVWVHQRV